MRAVIVAAALAVLASAYGGRRDHHDGDHGHGDHDHDHEHSHDSTSDREHTVIFPDEVCPLYGELAGCAFNLPCASALPEAVITVNGDVNRGAVSAESYAFPPLRASRYREDDTILRTAVAVVKNKGDSGIGLAPEDTDGPDVAFVIQDCEGANELGNVGFYAYPTRFDGNFVVRTLQAETDPETDAVQLQLSVNAEGERVYVPYDDDVNESFQLLVDSTGRTYVNKDGNARAEAGTEFDAYFQVDGTAAQAVGEAARPNLPAIHASSTEFAPVIATRRTERQDTASAFFAVHEPAGGNVAGGGVHGNNAGADVAFGVRSNGNTQADVLGRVGASFVPNEEPLGGLPSGKVFFDAAFNGVFQEYDAGGARVYPPAAAGGTSAHNAVVVPRCARGEFGCLGISEDEPAHGVDTPDGVSASYLNLKGGFATVDGITPTDVAVEVVADKSANYAADFDFDDFAEPLTYVLDGGPQASRKWVKVWTAEFLRHIFVEMLQHAITELETHRDDYLAWSPPFFNAGGK